MDMEEHCRVCGQTRHWHLEHNPHHMFTTDSSRPKLPEPPQSQRPTLMGDMVLRLTLLRKGVVTEVELAETRIWIEKASELGQVVILEPDSDGEGFKFRLATPDQLVREMVDGQTNGKTQEEAQEVPVRPPG